MRILFVGPYPPVRDGIGAFTWMLGREMNRAGHEIGVVVPYSAPGMPAEVRGTLTRPARERDQLRRLTGGWNPDVVHVQFAIAAFGTRTAALIRWLTAIRRYWDGPVVVTMHEPTREARLLPVLGPVVHRAIARRSDHFIVHTEAARRSVLAVPGVSEDRVSLTRLPDGRFAASAVSAGQLRSRFALGDARVLLAFGFIHPGKGLDDLVDALRILRDTRPAVLAGVRVVVAGAVRPRYGWFRLLGARDRRYLARLRSRIAGRGLQDLILMTGYVPDGEVAAWFDGAAAVVLPYRTAEQSGVAGLARAAGTPVLASTAGGLAEQSGGPRWTFPPGEPARLAQTLAEFLAAPPARPAAAPPHDIAPVAAATLDLYRSAGRAGAARVS
jgi:glycosyltransferase involved in cell wall biosynthesis